MGRSLLGRKSPDFGTMHKDVDAVIGLPASFWYEVISAVFHDAKVVLSLRDNEEGWTQSLVKHTERVTSHGGYRLLNRIALDWLVRRFVRHQQSFT